MLDCCTVLHQRFTDESKKGMKGGRRKGYVRLGNLTWEDEWREASICVAAIVVDFAGEGWVGSRTCHRGAGKAKNAKTTLPYRLPKTCRPATLRSMAGNISAKFFSNMVLVR